MILRLDTSARQQWRVNNRFVPNSTNPRVPGNDVERRETTLSGIYPRIYDERATCKTVEVNGAVGTGTGVVRRCKALFIMARFNIELDEVSVGRLLKALGFPN